MKTTDKIDAARLELLLTDLRLGAAFGGTSPVR